MLDNSTVTQEAFVAAFLRPPLFQTQYDRGYGTIYSAIYRPTARRMDYRWTNQTMVLNLDDFRKRAVTVELQENLSLSEELKET